MRGYTGQKWRGEMDVREYASPSIRGFMQRFPISQNATASSDRSVDHWISFPSPARVDCDTATSIAQLHVAYSESPRYMRPKKKKNLRSFSLQNVNLGVYATHVRPREPDSSKVTMSVTRIQTGRVNGFF